MRERVGEAADRRHTAPIASVTLWVLLCGLVVVVAHLLSRGLPARLGSYRTGIITISAFATAALYSVRKQGLWLSVRWLRLATRMPRAIGRRLVLFDRLESWRTLHLSIGVLAMLPFWWHVDAGRSTPIALTLEVTVIMVAFSGLLGTAIHDLLPHFTRDRPGAEVRLEDVEAAYHRLFIEAEESVLGHSEKLVRTYLKHVRPLLTGSQAAIPMLWAGVSNGDPAPRAVAAARRAEPLSGDEQQLYERLLGIAERKVRLELNEFMLRFGRVWLRLHIALVIVMACVLVFHIVGVLYFVGV